MIALLLAGTAAAQVFTDPAQGCLADDGWPVAGNIGLENGLSALRINAQTYSATRFAEEHVYPVWEEVREDIDGGTATASDRFVKVAYEYNAAGVDGGDEKRAPKEGIRQSSTL